MKRFTDGLKLTVIRHIADQRVLEGIGISIVLRLLQPMVQKPLQIGIELSVLDIFRQPGKQRVGV